MLTVVPELKEPLAFGEKYLLVEHIATGGMAEIYRAQYTGIEGFAKDLVIKRLREEYAKRPEVVEMFLNEAKVAATLTHNNIIHTYDLGEIGGEYYIAMELLRGEELVAVLRRGVAIERPMPQPLAIGIIQQVLEGLHYAHEREQNGDAMGIVHRDINPTNVYVGYDGVCKIVDFGIVLTRATRRRSTDKFAGKMSYMAPEQMRGEQVDRRSDLFPVGVMLYEMTVGQRLFRGSPQDVRRRVLEGDIPAPTVVDPEFPPALESIILRALEGDPQRRYPTADHMFAELDAYLQQNGQSWSARAIREYLSQLFEEEGLKMPQDDDYQDMVDDPFAPEDLEEALARYQAAKTPWANFDADLDAPKKPRRAMTLGSIAALVPDEPEPIEPDPDPLNRPGRAPLGSPVSSPMSSPSMPAAASMPVGPSSSEISEISEISATWPPKGKSNSGVLVWSLVAVVLAVVGAAVIL